MATKELALDVATRPRPPAPRINADPAHSLVGPSPLNASSMQPAAGLGRAGGFGSVSAAAPDVVSRARTSVALQQTVGNARTSTVTTEPAKALASNLLPPVRRESPAPPIAVARSTDVSTSIAPRLPSPQVKSALMVDASRPPKAASAAIPPAPVPAVTLPVARNPLPIPAKPIALGAPLPVPPPSEMTAKPLERAPSEAEDTAAKTDVAQARVSRDGAIAPPAEAPAESAERAPQGKTSPAVEVRGERDGVPAAGEKDSQAKGDTKSATQNAASETEAPAKKEAPSARAAIAPTAGAVRHRATGARAHSKADVPVGSAQAAALTPATEKVRGAAEATVKGMDAADADRVRRDAFKKSLKEAIEKATPQPKTEDEAERVQAQGAAQASGALRGELTTQRDAAAGPMKDAAKAEVTADSQPAPPETRLQPEPIGQPPAPVSGAAVVPPPLPPEQLDYSSDRAPTDNAMADAGVTQEQLEKGNEPAFGATLESRSTAEKHEAKAEGQYRKAEAKVQDKAHGAAQEELAKGLGGMHGVRGMHIGKVGDQQKTTQSKNAAERKRITDTITGIKNQTKAEVDQILQEMDGEAAAVFEAGLADAERVYEEIFEDEKGGVGTWLTTWGSDWEELIERSLGRARQAYLLRVDDAIDKVADCVDAKLKAAKQRVTTGRDQVEAFVAGLDLSVKTFGQEALQAVSADFDALDGEIDQRRDALIDKLAQQYKASYERMSAMEEKLREANRSLWQRVYDATVGLIKKILAFKDMLVSILAKAAEVVVDIISDPIGFLGNLVSGVMLGLENFMGNISAHLKKGLLDWLFGALGGAGLQLPETLDLKGIVSIALQVLGLTYANFRARAVAIVGEPMVSALEETAEVFKVIVTEGIPGLWRFIKEKLEDLKSMVLDAIFAFVEEKVIVAGITWLIGLLNPVSAFFKACKAIYDIVMFFIERGSQILALVNAIIDSMASIAKGNIAVAAKFVENALAKAIPVAIGFLAALLGLGDISGTIRKIIDKAQAPINKAIDWVIHQAVKLVKTVGKAIGGLFGTNKEKGEQKAAEGEEGHIAIAQEMGADLVDEDVSGGSPKEAMKRKAHERAPTYSKRLEPGVKLSVEFTDPPPDKADEEIDFTIVIAPNTTRVKFTKGLVGYLSAEAGSYSVLKAKEGRKNQDGTIQEAHHAPPVELANSLGSALVEAGDELADDYPDTSKLLGDAGAEFIAQAQGHGSDLSAILLNEKTHRIRGGSGPRIHGSDIRKYLAKYLTGRKGKDVARTTKGEIAVKPGGATFRSQISSVAQTVSKQDDLAVALRDHGPDIVSRVYVSEEARSLGAAEQALSQSEVDGPAKDRRSAIATLKSITKSTWGALVKAVKF